MSASPPIAYLQPSKRDPALRAHQRHLAPQKNSEPSAAVATSKELGIAAKLPFLSR
jgi:hypothetical protein